MSFGVSGEQTKLGLSTDSPARLQTFASQFGSNYAYLYTNLGWGRDTRDSALWTTRGIVRRANLELAPVGDLNYYRATLESSWYYSFNRDLTLMMRGEFGVSNGLGNKPLPFFKNLYAGGIGSVRGYRTASLGPRDPTDDTSIGGNRRVVGDRKSTRLNSSH